MEGTITNGQLVWVSGEKNAQQYFSWNTPGIITNVTDTTFTVMQFDEFKEMNYEKDDYSVLEKHGRADYIGGVHNHYKNSIMFIDQKRMDEYTQQQETLRIKRKNQLDVALQQAQNNFDNFNNSETFAEIIKKYIPDTVDA